jgi:hypothetical protein
MGQSTNIPWTQGMNYGMGVNLLNGDIAGKAVNPGEITGPTQAGGQTTSYNLSLINSFEELYSSIGISVEASGHYGLFSASGKFKYAKESKFNSQSTFLLARCVVENAFTQVEDAQIKPESSKLLEQGKIAPFQKRYGDGFVRGMQTGGEFFAIISITSSSREEQESISASLQAKYGGLFASVQVDTSLDSKTKSKVAKSELRVSTYQRGGSGDDQSFTADIEAVMARLKAFPNQVKNTPVPYDVQVASYETLALPEGPNPIDIQAQKDALVDYERIHLSLITLRNEIGFLQLHPDYFVNPPDNNTLNQWSEFVTNEINALIKQASKCCNSPVGGCELFKLQLPADFKMPDRKIDKKNLFLVPDLRGMRLNDVATTYWFGPGHTREDLKEWQGLEWSYIENFDPMLWKFQWPGDVVNGLSGYRVAGECKDDTIVNQYPAARTQSEEGTVWKFDIRDSSLAPQFAG